MDIVPLTPAEDAAMAAEEAQRLEWERSQLTGLPMDDSSTAGELGLCGFGPTDACAPKCCQGPAMTREAAKADAENALRGPVIVVGAGITFEPVLNPEEVVLQELAAEPGGLPRLAEAWGIPMSILLQAEKITNGQRQKDYGTALDNHERIARFWTAFLQNLGYDIVVQPEWVAEMMILMKIARIQNDITEDGLVDIAGYANVIDKMRPQRAERAARLADEL